MSSPPSDLSAVGVVLLVIAAALVVAAFRAWGAISAWPWVVAASTLQALRGLRLIAYAPTVQERAAGALALLVAVGLIALIAHIAKSGWRPFTTKGEGGVV